MAKRIYVGNLSNDTTENQLRHLFAQAGRVESVRIMADRKAWPSIVAFVEMGDDDAKRAIAELNGQEVNRRKLHVRDLTDLLAWLPQRDRAA